jgi:tRNA (guanine-N7-)-methyltransferase
MKSLFFVPTVEFLKKSVYQELPAPLQLGSIVGDRKLVVEIGSGHGEVLLSNDRTASVMIGYEKKSRFFKLTRRKIRRRDDIFVFQGDGYESLAMHYKNESIDRIYILFPDPWHKRKHNKRRPITAKFFLSVAKKLKKGGDVIVASDWPDYVDFIDVETKKCGEVYDISRSVYDPTLFGLPITHFHQKWIRKGRKFVSFQLVKRD